MLAALGQLPIHIRAAEAGGDDPSGVWTSGGPERLLDPARLEQLTRGMPRIKLPGDIAGGIRDPHVHVAGEAVLLDRAQFKVYMGLVAKELAERLANKADYAAAVLALRDLK